MVGARAKVLVSLWTKTALPESDAACKRLPRNRTSFGAARTFARGQVSAPRVAETPLPES
jgi:hypothetical protein